MATKKDEKNGAVEVNTVTETIAKRRETIEAKNAERNDLLSRRQMLVDLGADESHPMVAEIVAEIAKVDASIATAQRSLAASEAAEKTAGMIKPLIEAVGEVTVNNTGNLPSGTLSLVDLDKLANEYAAAIAKAQDCATMIAAVQAGVKKAKIGDDVIGDFLPIKFVSRGEKRATIEVSTRAASGGTRAPSPSVVLTTIPDGIDGASVGDRVRGEGSKFPTWTKLIDVVPAAMIRPEWSTTKDGKPRSMSARDKAEALGFKWDEVPTEAAS